jgi:hypothetical protein
MIDRRHFIGLLGLVGLSLTACGNSGVSASDESQVQAQVTESLDSIAGESGDSGNDAKLFKEYLESDEVKGFTAAAGVVIDACDSYQNGDYDACLSKLDQSALDAFDALKDKEDVPEVAEEVHGDFVNAAVAYYEAAMYIMTGSYLEDESKKRRAGNLALQQISDANDYLNEAVAAMDRARKKITG